MASRQQAVNARLTQGFSHDELVKAVQLKALHDMVEIAAYRGLQAGIDEAKLTSSDITEECSKQLLCHVKKAAHLVMYAEEGYVPARNTTLTAKQFAPILKQVANIRHDRDLKLTNATYTDLNSLIANLDEHNEWVNNLLFTSWGVFPFDMTFV